MDQVTSEQIVRRIWRAGLTDVSESPLARAERASAVAGAAEALRAVAELYGAGASAGMLRVFAGGIEAAAERMTAAGPQQLDLLAAGQ